MTKIAHSAGPEAQLSTAAKPTRQQATERYEDRSMSGVEQQMEPGGGTPEISQVVGYCKPPVHTRFKKGQSGNPSGRRKKKTRVGIFDIFQEELDRILTVRYNGKSVRMTALEHIIFRQFLRAAKGDVRALQTVLPHLIAEPEIVEQVPRKVLLPPPASLYRNYANDKR
jgi:hypothetical protein